MNWNEEWKNEVQAELEQLYKEEKENSKRVFKYKGIDVSTLSREALLGGYIFLYKELEKSWSRGF